MATTIPADVAILSHPDFVAARHSTNWVEDRLDLVVARRRAAPADAGRAATDEAEPRVLREVTAEVDGRRYQVQALGPRRRRPVAAGGRGGRPARTKPPDGRRPGSGSGTVAVPMQGTIVKVLVAVGDTVEVGQTVCVLEAMKMENAINAEKAGTVKEVRVAAGDSVGPGDVIAVIE